MATLPFKVKGQEGAIPAVGLGTATIKGDACAAAVVDALKLGYKLLDTALLVSVSTCSFSTQVCGTCAPQDIGTLIT